MADASREPTPEIRAVLERLKRGLWLCGRCRQRRATRLWGGVDGRARCVACSGIERRDEDRARRLLVAQQENDQQRRRRLEAARALSVPPLPAGVRRIVGYVSVFNQPYRRRDGFDEVVRYGAFRDAIRRGGLALVMDHDERRVVARQADGSLRLTENHFGLFIEATLASTDGARDALRDAERGVLAGSFAFRTCDDELTHPPRRQRILTRVDLTHVSVARRDRAAYQGTWLSVDSASARQRATRCEADAIRRVLDEARL